MWSWISDAVNRNAYFVAGEKEKGKELASETLVYLVEHKNIAEKVYETKSVAYLIKIMKGISQEGSVVDTFGKCGKSQKMHYMYYRKMKKVSEQYNIPLIESNAYMFYALCQMPSVSYTLNIIKNALNVTLVPLDENRC